MGAGLTCFINLKETWLNLHFFNNAYIRGLRSAGGLVGRRRARWLRGGPSRGAPKQRSISSGRALCLCQRTLKEVQKRFQHKRGSKARDP